MNSKVTQTQKEKHCHKVLFDVKGRLAMIHTLIQKGVLIEMDTKCKYACAYFDNTIDYNNFKDMIARLSAPVSA